ncbi:MAG: hypothetical protein L3J63_01350 [Geopsychrobacter sp.]|nr:hypothetical protein [Geopsychrobacter sp.]
MLGLILLPMTPVTALGFSLLIGFLWLATVPLTGSYTGVWMIAMGLGLMATLLHLPINDTPLDAK